MTASAEAPRRSRLATLRAAFGLVGAILQGGRGEARGAGEVERRRQPPIDEGFGATDVYRLADAPPSRAAILMMHGLTPDGPDDHRIPGFATTCARGGMTVVIPDFPAMRAQQMRVEDVDDIARAAGAVPAAVGVDKVVLLAFSYSAGPAYLAAERLGEVVAGTVTVGAYYDLDHLLEWTATARVGPYGDDQPEVEPDPEKRFIGRWVFLTSAARWIDDEADRQVLEKAGAAWKRGQPPPWEEIRPRLSRSGRALLDAITVEDTARHLEARERMPEGVREAMRRLTLRGKLGALTTPVVLIHGRHDVRIPFRESLLLHEALVARTDVKLAVLNAFVHAQRAVGWSRFWRVAGDAVKLGSCGFEILGWAV